MPTPYASTSGQTSASANFGKTMDDINVRSTGMKSSASENQLNAGYTAKYNARGTELKKIWQSVLRECHRSDPDRCGQVSRNVFIAALEKSDLDKVRMPLDCSAVNFGMTLLQLANLYPRFLLCPLFSQCRRRP